MTGRLVQAILPIRPANAQPGHPPTAGSPRPEGKALAACIRRMIPSWGGSGDTRGHSISTLLLRGRGDAGHH
jgi:hypothetical protein